VFVQLLFVLQYFKIVFFTASHFNPCPKFAGKARSGVHVESHQVLY